MLVSNRFWRSTALQTRVFILTVLTTICSLVFLALFSTSTLNYALQKQVGKRAILAAETIAVMPLVIHAVKHKNSQVIIGLLEPLRINLGATYIVIMNNNALSDEHLFRVDLGGKRKQIPTHSLRTGRSHSEFSNDILGPSMIGEAPIIKKSGEVIGIVIVDFLEQDIKNEIDTYNMRILIICLFAILASAATARAISKGIKKVMFGLEPTEIARLFSERDAIVESVREAIISLDKNGKITKVNQSTFKIFNLADDLKSFDSLYHFLKKSGIFAAIEKRKAMLDFPVESANKALLITVTPLLIQKKFSGHVISIREKDALQALSQELNKTQHYSELLRAQTHEHANKMHALNGMLQVGAIDEAIALISQTNEDQQSLISFLIKAVSDPILAGLLIGKFNRAKELGLFLKLDENSSMIALFDTKSAEHIITVLGNILDNAFEATLKQKDAEPIITLSMSDIGDELIFEVEDNGTGFDEQQRSSLFSKGVSSKNRDGHGFGLYLVEQALKKLNGQIELMNKNEIGAVVTVYIPKERR